jgi:hypothetical protein
MRNLTQPWKLCRSFGIRPVGNVAGPRWPEAGISAQQIPSQPSRWTYRGKVDTPCRPADLPTCRPAVSGCLTSVTALMFPPPSTPRLEISPQAFPLGHACPPKAQQWSERHLRYFARGAIFLNSSFPAGNSEEPKNERVNVNQINKL